MYKYIKNKCIYSAHQKRQKCYHQFVDVIGTFNCTLKKNTGIYPHRIYDGIRDVYAYSYQIIIIEYIYTTPPQRYNLAADINERDLIKKIAKDNVVKFQMFCANTCGTLRRSITVIV